MPVILLYCKAGGTAFNNCAATIDVTVMSNNNADFTGCASGTVTLTTAKAECNVKEHNAKYFNSVSCFQTRRLD